MNKAKSYRLDVVVPCYNEAAALPHTIPVLTACLDELVARADMGVSRFQLILVDDGSSDDTWHKIQGFANTDGAKGVKLSRNYGHQNAMLAGLSFAGADVILTIDSDLQDDVSAIVDMLKAFENGADMALGVRRSRDKDGFFKKHSAQAFYRLMKLMGAQIVADHADFRLLSHRALKALLAHEEANLFMRGIIPSLGFKTAIIRYDRKARNYGETRYTLGRMLSLAFNGITAFSTVPLRFVAVLGVFVFLASMLLLLWFLSVRLFGSTETVPGWASTVLPILGLGGLQIFCMGIIGEYVGRIYLEVKRRPRFIVEETTDDT